MPQTWKQAVFQAPSLGDSLRFRPISGSGVETTGLVSEVDLDFDFEVETGTSGNFFMVLSHAAFLIHQHMSGFLRHLGKL